MGCFGWLTSQLAKRASRLMTAEEAMANEHSGVLNIDGK